MHTGAASGATETGDSPGLPLAGRGAEWFADWIVEGILWHEFGPMAGVHKPFEGAMHLMGDHGTLVDELTSVYRRHLSPAQQRHFDDGLAHAMRRLKLPSKGQMLLGQRLLQTAVRVGAYDAIHVLASKIDCGRDDELTRDLVADAVEAISAWPLERADDTVDALYRLSESAAFGELQARWALGALCKARPEQLVQHLIKLSSLLAERYAPYFCAPASPRWDERRARVCEILTSVKDARILLDALEGWPERLPTGAVPGNKAQSADWLYASLVDEVLSAKWQLRLAATAPPTGEQRQKRAGQLVADKTPSPAPRDAKDREEALADLQAG